ncbi:MAG: hypothetical protein DRP45_05065 [Candidatus Zixiibacteriota bacterium]|nr:MAG: hypothetical protein DRP45_05065 [candidate division Zixibacteria bacterium]
MYLNAKIYQQILLYSLAVLVLPLVLFPSRLGMDLADGGIVNLLYEFVFYGFVISFLNRPGNLIKLVQACSVCLVYRLILGGVFGLLTTVLYSMNLGISLSLGMFSYLPTILLQIAIAPFALKPLLSQFYQDDPGRKRPMMVVTSMEENVRVSTSSPTAESVNPVSTDVPMSVSSQTDQAPSASFTPGLESVVRQDAFGRAVRYIGEHASVHLAAIVDHEGLLLSSFKRGDIDSEEWAPLALLFFEKSSEVLDRRSLGVPSRLDMLLDDRKLNIARDTYGYMIVVSDRDADEMLNIRINQALEMVRKYVSERYSKEVNPSGETIHV